MVYGYYVLKRQFNFDVRKPLVKWLFLQEYLFKKSWNLFTFIFWLAKLFGGQVIFIMFICECYLVVNANEWSIIIYSYYVIFLLVINLISWILIKHTFRLEMKRNRKNKFQKCGNKKLVINDVERRKRNRKKLYDDNT